MNTQQFISTIEKILKDNSVVDWDRQTVDEYIKNEKKNSVVTIVKTADGKEFFFKAIKPTANPRHILDYKKGIVLSDVLKNAQVTSFPSIIKNGVKEGIFYLFARVVPIDDTLSDEKLVGLSGNDAQKLVSLYEENQKKIQTYLSTNITDAAFLYPYSDITQTFSFPGLISLFERRLVGQKILTGEKGYAFSQSILEAHTDDFFTSGKPFLLHGDFVPHNIVYSEEIYFVDWERAFITFNSYVGESFDLADLYTASHLNKEWLGVLYRDTDSFKLCLTFHLLSKLNNIVLFGERARPLKPEHSDGEREKIDVFFEWCIEEYTRLYE